MRLHAKSKQTGAVLIVALMFLVILTMLGVTAMTGTTMEQRMANNTRDVGIAFQAAEAALRDARNDILGKAFSGGSVRNPPMHVSEFGDGTGLDNGTCGGQGLCRPYTYDPTVDAILPAAPSVSMTGPPSVQYGTFTGAQPFSGVSRQPRYIIEIFGLPSHAEPLSGSPYVYYRITARGYGGNPNSQVTLQEVFIHYPS